MRRPAVAAARAALNGPSGSDPKARVTYLAMYPDGLGRTVAAADYGTNANGSFTRSTTVPSRSDAVLVSSTVYNSCGEVFTTTDPAATVNQSFYDAAGRRIRQVENYISGGTDDDENRTTEWTYNADGRTASLKAVNAATGDQITSYSYGVTVAGGSGLTSFDLLHVETYPDSGTVVHEYNRQGQQTLLTDQNGTVHAYLYDKLGRRIPMIGRRRFPSRSIAACEGSPRPTKSAGWSRRSPVTMRPPAAMW